MKNFKLFIIIVLLVLNSFVKTMDFDKFLVGSGTHEEHNSRFSKKQKTSYFSENYIDEESKHEFEDIAAILIDLKSESNSEKVLGCSYEKCEKSFVERDDLVSHISSTHLPKLIFCSYLGCTRSFFNNQEFRKHFNSKHKSKRKGKKGQNLKIH